MKRILLVMAIVGLIVCMGGFIEGNEIYATVLTFEDLAPSSPGYGIIPSNYAGFTWSASSGYITKDATPYAGYINGTIDYVSLFSIQAINITIERDSPFDFLGAYLNYHLNTLERTLVIEGSKNGLVKYSTTIIFNDPHDTTWYDFKYNDIDSLIFRSNEYIVVDNITFREATITIDAVIKFFDDSVADGSLTGEGKGNSANGRLNALRNMLEMAGDLIAIGDIEGACGQLKAVLKKCDNESPPPDFVTGEAVTTLHDMILELMAELGCE